jgi:antibiotic biosynthesis monooxygenase (ABM) superfamily enzyme
MSHVTRIIHRRANPGQEAQFEQLVRGMLEACSQSPGYLFSTVIPPRIDGEEFHMVQCFASSAALDAWRNSTASAQWHERLRSASAHDPEYRVFKTSDLWFSATGLQGEKQPARWRMAFVTWLGIYLLATLTVAFLLPLLTDVPFVLRMMIATALIVLAMYWIVMPRLLRWLGRWLRAEKAGVKSS